MRLIVRTDMLKARGWWGPARGGTHVARAPHKEGVDGGQLRLDFDGSEEAERQYREVVARYRGTPLWMKAPNGQPTKLTERQWVQVRTPNFKRWFGKWEAINHQRFLTGATVVTLAGTEFQKEATPITKRVAEWFAKAHGGKATNPVIGAVMLNERGVKDSIAHGLGREKAAAFAAVPAIIERGRVIDVERDWKGRGYDGFTVAAPVRIGEQEYVGVVIVHRDENTHRFYLQEVILRESLQREPFKTEASTGGKAALNGGHAGAIAIMVQGVFEVHPEEVSKVVDANGEPLVVYHQTRAQPGGKAIKEFQPGGDSPMVSGAATWATPDPSKKFSAHNTLRGHVIGKYHDGVYDMPLFMRITRPLVSEDKTWRQSYAPYSDGSPWTLYPDVVRKMRADHDGIMHFRSADVAPSGRVWSEGGLAEVAVFDAGQIKSAIGNDGNFKPGEASIMKSAKPIILFLKGHRHAA